MGLQIRGDVYFGQFVLDVASVACVIQNCPLMRGRAIHQWIFVQMVSRVTIQQ